MTLPTLTFGTMRMDPAGAGSQPVRRLFDALLAEPEVALHSSDEYDSFPCLSATLASLPRSGQRRIRHIVKLAEPSFGLDSFDPQRVRARVDSYLRELHTERLDVVQWMVRATLDDKAARLQLVEDVFPAAGACFAALQREGLVGAVVLFPYAVEDIELAAGQPWCDGFAIYVNLQERVWIEAVDSKGHPDQAVLAIRPLGAGQAIAPMGAAASLCDAGMDDLSPAECCIRWPLLHPRVLTSIVSASTPAHLDGARRAARTAADRSRYERVLGAAGSEAEAR